MLIVHKKLSGLERKENKTEAELQELSRMVSLGKTLRVRSLYIVKRGRGGARLIER